ncbi:uncharacterized protein LOC112088013 [Eutrema salsugineum]|uniref:uncharacterized protein LOC112088013 n=1 Tax=Eutrema salsugineum TaxID=72664 RepID=UPI000CED5953|nr:uncharacterized protein LOC112088013 [Eutrema salsugineum]
MSDVVDVACLDTYKTGWLISVKVVRLWKHSTFFGYTIEMVLSDIKGTRIAATIMPNEFPTRWKEIKQGQWIQIFNFHIKEATGSMLTTINKHRLQLTSVTIITPIRTRSYNLYLHCFRFYDIVDRAIPFDYLIDVMGTIVNMGPLCNASNDAYEENLAYLRFEIVDALRDGRLACYARGSLAINLHDVYLRNTCESVVWVLRFWKMTNGKGIDKKSVILRSNDLCSDFLYNPVDAEVDAFRAT